MKFKTKYVDIAATLARVEAAKKRARNELHQMYEDLEEAIELVDSKMATMAHDRNWLRVKQMGVNQALEKLSS
jgi:phage regulator Rha-like protein